MTHHAAPAFWDRYHALPTVIQELADKAFALLKADPRHSSLHLKKVSTFWSVRVGLHHRAIGVQAPDIEGSVFSLGLPGGDGSLTGFPRQGTRSRRNASRRPRAKGFWDRGRREA